QWQQVGITAMGLAVQSYKSTDAFEESEGVFPALFESEGAEIVNSGNGAAAPTPGARFAARVLESGWRHNQLSGKRFIHVVLMAHSPSIYAFLNPSGTFLPRIQCLQVPR